MTRDELREEFDSDQSDYMMEESRKKDRKAAVITLLVIGVPILIDLTIAGYKFVKEYVPDLTSGSISHIEQVMEEDNNSFGR